MPRIITDLNIIPALSLDSSLFLDSEVDALFDRILGGSSLASANRLGPVRTYRASDILRELPLVAEFFFHATEAGTDGSLLGGFVFLDGADYLFGGEECFSDQREWERVLKVMCQTTKLQLDINQTGLSLERRGEELFMRYGRDEYTMKYSQFFDRAGNALAENYIFKSALLSALQSRFGVLDSHLLRHIDPRRRTAP